MDTRSIEKRYRDLSYKGVEQLRADWKLMRDMFEVVKRNATASDISAQQLRTLWMRYQDNISDYDAMRDAFSAKYSSAYFSTGHYGEGLGLVADEEARIDPLKGIFSGHCESVRIAESLCEAISGMDFEEFDGHVGRYVGSVDYLRVIDNFRFGEDHTTAKKAGASELTKVRTVSRGDYNPSSGLSESGFYSREVLYLRQRDSLALEMMSGQDSTLLLKNVSDKSQSLPWQVFACMALENGYDPEVKILPGPSLTG